jgi:hypothetical protein
LVLRVSSIVYQQDTHDIDPFRIPGRTQLTNDPIPKRIPNGSFDCGDGYYVPKDNIIYDYNGKELRIPGLCVPFFQ